MLKKKAELKYSFLFNMNYFDFLEMVAPINVSAWLVVLKRKAGRITEGCTFVHASFKPTELWTIRTASKFPTSCRKFPAAACLLQRNV